MSIEISCNLQGVEEFEAALERFDANMQRNVQKQLEGWAADVQALARQLAPVRTGYLRSSIYAKIREWVAEVGAEAVYALFVEFGTFHARARPFLYPAVQECLPRLELVICRAIDDARAEAGV